MMLTRKKNDDWFSFCRTTSTKAALIYSTYQLIMHKPRLARTPTFTPFYKRINCARTIGLNLMKIVSFKSSKLPLLIDKISSDFHWPIISIFGMPPFCRNDSLNSLPHTQIELREEIVQ